MTTPKYTCKVCNTPFDDGWKHALKWSHGMEGIGTPVDQAHAMAEMSFRNRNWEGECPFCGSKVNHFIQGGSDGDVSWEIICTGCQFLFDED